MHGAIFFYSFRSLTRYVDLFHSTDTLSSFPTLVFDNCRSLAQFTFTLVIFRFDPLVEIACSTQKALKLRGPRGSSEGSTGSTAAERKTWSVRASVGRKTWKWEQLRAWRDPKKKSRTIWGKKGRRARLRGRDTPIARATGPPRRRVRVSIERSRSSITPSLETLS